jgi:hypothetical protein
LSLPKRLALLTAAYCLVVAGVVSFVSVDQHAAATGGCAAEAEAQGYDTTADMIHPNIHDNNDRGNNANPNGIDNPQGTGGNMHGIGNNPGKGGNAPGDDDSGFADQLGNVHGGIGNCNPNA